METNNEITYAKPMLGFMEAVKICFNKFFDFTGRARRSEYWWFALFQILVSIPCTILDELLDFAVGFSGINTIASLALLFPALSVTWRRLHDTGRSGWWYGISCILLAIGIIIGIIMVTVNGISGGDMIDDDALFSVLFGASSLAVWIPIIAATVLAIICFVFTLLDSHTTENKYGPSPKYQ